MKQQIRLLCAEADREALRPVLEALRARGVRVREADGAVGKDDVLLAALSERFYADSEAVARLLDCVAAGAETVLPLQLDGAPMPERLKNALYSRNIIPAAGRDAAHTAARILDALPKKKSRLPLLLTAGALVLVALFGVLLWRAARSREAVPALSDETIAVAVSLGLTEEDLAAVEDVVIVGEQAAFFTAEDRSALDDWPDESYFATLDEWVSDGEAVRWYSKADGRELGTVRYEDLRFLSLMPNLKYLTLALVEADEAALPDLREAASLRSVQLLSCEIHGLGWLAGSSIESLSVRFTPIEDFGVLSACERLNTLRADLYQLPVRADFSAFAPPALEYLWLWHANSGGTLELSGLGGCPALSTVIFGDLPLTDLACLSGAGALRELTLVEMQGLRGLSGLGQQPLERLEIDNSYSLREVSAVGDLKQLRDLYIGYCPRVTDYSPIAGCTALERIHIQGDLNPDAIRDASFLAELPRLRDIGLYSCNLNNMDFLEGIAAHQSSIELGFAGDILDYSGLSAVRRYEYLHVNPRNQTGNRGGDFSAVLPYIRDAQIDNLMLYSCRGVDLSELPDGIGDLSICYGDLSDLSGLKPYSLRRLELRDCQYLTSLNGIESIPTLFGNRGQMDLEIIGCPRLTDYAALEGAYLETLTFTGVYTLPEMSAFRRTNNLFLESIDWLSDLNCLAGLNGGDGCNLSLVGLDALYDLTPLRSLSGDHLTVPPQVAEQAEELVEDGVFDSFEVAYPDGSWQPFDGTVELLSLDELETLPTPLLRRVERLCLVGDTLIDMEQGDIWEDWADGSDRPRLLLHSYATDEISPIEYGAGPIADMSVFAGLTGLRELKLYAQGLETLNGVQALPELDNFTASYCLALTDASAAFACPQLQWLNLRGCPIESIRGVQNLSELRELDLAHTGVADLTPLLELEELETVRVSADMTEAIESLNGADCGFALEIEGG